MTAAELLSVAAFEEGRYAQAFPTFGSERTGAPVVAFCRIDDRPIRVREPIVEPDVLIVQDPTLLHQVDVFGGVGHDAFVLINTTRTFGKTRPRRPRRPASARSASSRLPATELAREHLGRPLPNAALLGRFAALTGVVSITSVSAAIQARFPAKVAAGNVDAAEAAYAAAQLESLEVVGA